MLDENYVINRIEELCEKRQMTRYRLAQVSGIEQSTLSNLLNRKSLPNIITLSKICDGFGITLSQFFMEEDKIVNLSEEQRHVLDTWLSLADEERELVKTYIQGIRRK